MVNMAVLCGRLGRDPESRHTQKGERVVSFSLATDGYRKDDGPDWHNVTAFGQPADFLAEYARKGAIVHVVGRIRYEEWTDKDGTKKKATKIIADRVRLISGGKPREDAADHPTAEQPFAADDSDVPF